MQTFEYETELWSLKAVYAEAVRDLESGGERDFWFWFVAHKGEDVWVAHALSETASEDIAARVAEAIPGGDTDIFLALMGEPWEILRPLPVQHAQMQRDLIQKIQATSEMDRLRRMTKGEILNERAREEIEVITRTQMSDN